MRRGYIVCERRLFVRSESLIMWMCNLNVKEGPLAVVEGASLRVEALFDVDEALCAKQARGPLWGCGTSVR